MDALRPSPDSGFVSRLALFVGVSVLSGVLLAGLSLPLFGSIGVSVRAGAEGFESLPAELETPPLPQRSRILAADGSLIANFYFENRVSVPLSDVAPVMRQAIIAIEDARYYEHGGIDLRGTLRAFVNNQTGQDVQGGSTLTQQYVKQVLLESAQNIDDEEARLEAQREATEQSYGRKLRELRYAVALEEKFSKEEILERYLNIAYFGAGAYGVEAAARHYFSRPASKLTLRQSALLAGVVQQPTAFDPTRNPERALDRRNVVLARMAEVGTISQAEADEAAEAKLGLRVSNRAGNGCDTAKAPFFCNYVLNVVKNDKAFGKTPGERVRLLLRGGLTIRTTLDRKAQRSAQKALRKYVNKKDRVAAAVAAVEPGTGAVKAIAINRDFGKGKGKTKQNYAVDKLYEGGNGFPGGSTFKPFVAVAALEKGYPFSYPIFSPYQKEIGDIRWCNGVLTDPYEPRNELTSENGTYTMASGMAKSVNTYWMQLEERTGVCRPVNVATDMGLTRATGDPLQQNKSFTLGVDPVSPLAMAEAYATFAARGTHCESIAITSVTDAAGQQLKVPTSDCTQVMEPKIADGVNELLQGVMEPGGTGARVDLDRPAAGKTGTAERVHVWFVGYTPDLATAVWAGNPSNFKYQLVNRTIGGRYYSTVCGGCLPGPIWQEMMTGALEGVPKSRFSKAPKSVSQGDAITVPSVSGRSVSDAKAVLRRANLRPVVSSGRVYATYAPEGTVAYSSPGTGAEVYPQQAVTLYISSGPPPEPEPEPTRTKKPDPGPTKQPDPGPTKQPDPEPTKPCKPDKPNCD
jgi:membrane peptidoglycan carboxypeptidase